MVEGREAAKADALKVGRQGNASALALAMRDVDYDIEQARLAAGGPPSPKPGPQYDHDLAEKILDRIRGGESLKRICKDPDMPYRQYVLGWVTAEIPPEAFDVRYLRACEARAEGWADEVVDLADDGKEDPDPRSRQLRVDTRKWVASKLLKKRFGDKVDVSVRGEPPFSDPGWTEERLARVANGEDWFTVWTSTQGPQPGGEASAVVAIEGGPSKGGVNEKPETPRPASAPKGRGKKALAKVAKNGGGPPAA
jgi:hypothetical protein